MARKLEICCNSFDDALAAARGGADRIELCEELWMGGVTPEDELITEVIKSVGIPVFVLVRPRGGDFVYDEEELVEMEGCITIARQLGCAGIVSGALTRDGETDLPAVRRLVAAARPLPFTFHRAFDELAYPAAALPLLGELGVDRVLTSKAGELAATAEDPPTLLACGGLRAANIAAMASDPALTEFHSAARASYDLGVEEEEVRGMKGQLGS
jgi:copper homeostasis protein